MLSREQLSQMSDSELEKYNNELLAKYEQRKGKNSRIQALLSNKVYQKEKSLIQVRDDLLLLRSRYPDIQQSLKKRDFF